MATSVSIIINGKYSCIHAALTQTFITVYDTDYTVLHTISNREFYEHSTRQVIPEYSPNTIHYYNPTEEQLFQYNTIMDFSTNQALVHLYDHLSEVFAMTSSNVKYFTEAFIRKSKNQNYKIEMEY